MVASRRLALSDLGRPALLPLVRIEAPAEAGPPRRWAGPRAEMEADGFLRTLPRRGPPGAWSWTVRVHILLEDQTPLTAHVLLRAGTAAPTIRDAAILGLRHATADLDSPAAQRGEARRILELLTGQPFRYEPAPDFRALFEESLRLLEPKPKGARGRAPRRSAADGAP